MARSLGDQRGIAASASNLALLVWARGSLEEAGEMAGVAGAVYGALGNKRGAIVVENLVAGLAFDRGDVSAAWRHSLATLDLVAETELVEPAIEAIEMAARLFGLGDRHLAAVLFGTARRHRHEQGLELAVWDVPRLDDLEATIRAALGDTADEVFAEGAGLELKTAIRLAKELGTDSFSSPT